MATEKQLVGKLLKTLRAKLGTGETPPGSNHNFITVWYNKNVDKIGDGAWCQMTVTWSMWVSGFKKLMSVGRAYTIYAVEDAIKGLDGSTWHWGIKGMRAGDHVYYDWTGKKKNIQGIDHVGTVERIMDDGTFYALEGNSSDKLQRTHRDATYVVGYVRPDYASMATKANKLDLHPTVPLKQIPAKKTVTKQESAGIEKVKALQTAVGVPADGKWGSATDKAVLSLRREFFNKS